MPAKKKTGAKTAAKRRNTGTARKTPAAKKKNNTFQRQILTVMLIMLGIFLLLCVLPFTSNLIGWVGPAIKGVFTGIYGFCGFILPLLLIYTAILLIQDKTAAQIVARIWLIIGIITCVSVCFSLFYNGSDDIGAIYKAGQEISCGGVIGTVICNFFVSNIGVTGTIVVMLTIIIILIVICSRITIKQIIHTIFPFRDEKVRSDAREYIENVNTKMEENEQNMYERKRSDKTGLFPKSSMLPKREIKIHKLKNSIDVPVDEDKYAGEDIENALSNVAIQNENVDENDGTDKGDAALESIISLASSSAIGAQNAVNTHLKRDTLDENKITVISSSDNASGAMNNIDNDENIDELISNAINKKMLGDENINVDVNTGEVIEKTQDINKDSIDESKNNTKDNIINAGENAVKKEYQFPPISLLKTSVSNNIDVSSELKFNAKKLTDTLKSFGVTATILNVARGPSVTRYELQPAPGVKISKITNLADDIALNLAASAVRIEAPIPGKAAVGIEVPNKSKSMVSIKEIIGSDVFRNSKSKLSVALGKDISGNIQITDLSKMPHLLIAGTTGSGKSVCLNSLITSILYKATPDEVKLLMIDPKTVEFRMYNGIPHLLIPVVTDPKKAAGALNWAVSEMLKRYKLFADNNVRDIKGYNAFCKRNPEYEKMSQIVIIIDELADLMMAAPGEVEDAICRLAQMARAAGMHLVIATQRPSVNVLTGTIKANIPSRIALFVSSQVDSRVILDTPGAEKLLGNGDMLFSPVGSNKPLRIQGCYVSDSETELIIDYIKNNSALDYDQKIIEHIEQQASAQNEKTGSKNNKADDKDSLYDEAMRVVIEAGMASATLLQRKLKLGYARAARIIDELEEDGIIGPYEGAKPRAVYMSKQQYQEKLMHESGDFTPKPDEF